MRYCGLAHINLVTPIFPFQASGRNLRRALLMLEATKVQQYPFSEQQALQMPDWELYIGALAKEVTAEQSPQKLLKAREMLYELLTNCIPADVIIKVVESSSLPHQSIASPVAQKNDAHFFFFFEKKNRCW